MGQGANAAGSHHVKRSSTMGESGDGEGVSKDAQSLPASELVNGDVTGRFPLRRLFNSLDDLLCLHQGSNDGEKGAGHNLMRYDG